MVLWFESNKKELINIGLGIGVAALAAVGIKNKGKLSSLLNGKRVKFKKGITRGVESIKDNKSLVKQSPNKHNMKIKLPENVVEFIPCDVVEKKMINIKVSEDFPVRQHIRTLPDGWSASHKKIEEAKALGICLKPNQTIVEGYRKKARSVS